MLIDNHYNYQIRLWKVMGGVNHLAPVAADCTWRNILLERRLAQGSACPGRVLGVHGAPAALEFIPYV